MAAPKDDIEVFVVHPRDFDKIIERSKGLKEPYTHESLSNLYYQGQAQNKVVYIFFQTTLFRKGPS